jgi:SpoVK/Ycf46/Vps4 family AAA+-type ATPase
MIEEKKKVSANETIIRMIHFMHHEKMDLFYKAVDEYSNGLATSSRYHFRLKKIVDEKPLKLIRLNDISDDVKKLISSNIFSEDNVFLNDSTKEVIDELILEWKNADVYNFHNLKIRNKILLHGSTGNGKTTIARHISKLAELPFIEINSDAIIDSHIGNTSSNINRIFNKIQDPCILFWDEIDSIGRKRGIGTDSAAGMENDRMVNSILVNLDRLSNKVILIGATNRRDVLDSAFVRRFDLKYELPAPTDQEKERFSKQMFEYYKLPMAIMPTSFEKYNSYSEIKSMLMDLARKFVLDTILTNNNGQAL